MYIKSVEITNFKCFSHKKIELDPNFNLIIGENNSGKSTFFEALRLWQLAIQQFYTARTSKKAHNVGFYKKSTYEALDVSDLTFLRIQDVNEIFLNKAKVFVIEICFSNGVDEAKVAISFKPTSRNTLNCKLFNELDTENTLSIEEEQTLISDSLFKVMKIANNDTFRNRIRLAYIPPKFTVPVKETLFSEKNELITENLILGKSQLVIRNILHRWCEVNYRNSTKQSNIRDLKSELSKVISTKDFDKNYSKTIKPYIEKILQEKIISDKNEKHKRLNEIENGLKKIIGQDFDFKSFNDPMKDADLCIKNIPDKSEISQLGSGTINVLNILTVLEYNNQTLDKASTKCNLLLLDEPDSHLHSNLQKELFNYLEKKSQDSNTQIFIITHNTSLISQFENVVFFEKESETIEPMQIKDYLEEHLKDMDINQYNVIKQLNEVKLKHQKLQEHISESEIPVILFEGATDINVFKIAYKKLYDKEFPFVVKNKVNGASNIPALINNHNNSLGYVIGIFDNDHEGRSQFKKIDKDFNLDEEDGSKYKGNTLVMLLPIPTDRNIPFYKRHLTIEYLFSNDNLRKMEVDIYKEDGESYFKIPCNQDKQAYSIDSRSKNIISQNCQDLESSAFENFRPIFEKIFEFTGFNPDA